MQSTEIEQTVSEPIPKKPIIQSDDAHINIWNP